MAHLIQSTHTDKLVYTHSVFRARSRCIYRWDKKINEYMHTIVSFFFVQTVRENKGSLQEPQWRAQMKMPGGESVGWVIARHVLMQSRRAERWGSGAVAHTSCTAPVWGSETKLFISLQILFLRTHTSALITVLTHCCVVPLWISAVMLNVSRGKGDN